MRAHFLLTVFLFLSVNHSFACSCEIKEPFSKVAKTADLVVLVKINKYLSFKNIYNESIPMSMEVEILETLKGKSDKKKIKVWGDDGAMCRPYLSIFPEGEFFYLALYSGREDYGHKDEKNDDYYISICGEFSLSADINKNIAISNFKNKKKTYSFETIKSYFRE